MRQEDPPVRAEPLNPLAEASLPLSAAPELFRELWGGGRKEEKKKDGSQLAPRLNPLAEASLPLSAAPELFRELWG